MEMPIEHPLSPRKVPPASPEAPQKFGKTPTCGFTGKTGILSIDPGIATI